MKLAEGVYVYEKDLADIAEDTERYDAVNRQTDRVRDGRGENSINGFDEYCKKIQKA